MTNTFLVCVFDCCLPLSLAALRGEVSAECGEDGAEYEQIMEKLRTDIETKSKCVQNTCEINSLSLSLPHPPPSLSLSSVA